MHKISIEPGLKYYDNQTPFLIKSEIENQFLVENLSNHDTSMINRVDLEMKFFNAEYIVDLDAISVTDPVPRAIDMLNAEQKLALDRKYNYVSRLVGLSGGNISKSLVAEVIDEVAALYGDTRPPSVSRVYAWHKQWRDGGQTKSALLSKSHKRGPQKPYISREAQALIDEVLRKKFLIRESPTLMSAYQSIVDTFKEYNDRHPLRELTCPSYSTIYRYIKGLDSYEVMLKRKGKQAADRFFKKVGKGVEVEAPLDLVQIDHTILDIHVLTPFENVVARPTLTVAFDVKTSIPIGIYVGFASPGYESVMLCLRNAILPKDVRLKQFEWIKKDWPCHGVMRAIVLDNGKEFHSEHLKDACNALGINIIYHPVRVPHYKGAVERFFGSINTGLLSQLKGKTFSNIAEKGDYDSVKNAAIPMAAFEKALYKWIVDVYLRRFNTGLEDYPIEVWQRGVKEYPVDLPASPEDLIILLSEVQYRKLTRKGVTVDKVWYNSDELNTYFRAFGKTTKIKVKIDPSDLGQAYVFNERSQKFMTVPAIESKYSGLSKWQHKATRKLLNLKRKTGDKKYNINDAFIEMHSLIDEEIKSSKKKLGKKKSGKRAARYKSGQNAKPPVRPSAIDEALKSIDTYGIEGGHGQATPTIENMMLRAKQAGLTNLFGQEGSDNE
ncbi:Mu transposase C-terminal domain-containing protein [Kordiimonas sp. SCSIO 12610]|uniref:Mu transposase C-terminal domain-containing protein n=1 Tax=Kordiimonas sp. SCSIO 12610 TaxID=2829597 RepID=UPI002108C38F|nr:Mu transposase C-terminal domain-containing protein [Kordiimonas sp. SCSIO 12610]UTW54822.1 DDE-type integrase/transposase/recombinase [Kordiimonas sp. SCSIO 12610]